jgi:hypothetical protein
MRQFDELEISCNCIFCTGRDEKGAQICSNEKAHFGGYCPWTTIGARKSCSCFVEEEGELK